MFAAHSSFFCSGFLSLGCSKALLSLLIGDQVLIIDALLNFFLFASEPFLTASRPQTSPSDRPLFSAGSRTAICTLTGRLLFPSHAVLMQFCFLLMQKEKRKKTAYSKNGFPHEQLLLRLEGCFLGVCSFVSIRMDLSWTYQDVCDAPKHSFSHLFPPSLFSFRPRGGECSCSSLVNCRGVRYAHVFTHCPAF